VSIVQDPTVSMRRSMKSAAWVGIGNVANSGISFVVFVVLARLLSPAEFGIVAVATVFLDILAVVARGGLPDAIVQKHDLEEEYADTAFWVSTGVGVLCCLVLLVASYPIALIFKMPHLQEVLEVLSIVFVIGGLGGIHEGRLQRAFGFRSLSIRGLVANLVSGGIALWLAFSGYGVWSLVVQRLLSSLAILIITWVAFPWLPRTRFNKVYAREQLAFGSKVFGTNLLLILNNRVHELIAALFLTAADVGYMRASWRCIDMISQLSVIPLSSVALPTFARLQREHGKLETAYMHFVSVSSTIAFPAMFGLAAIAPTLLPAVFGEQWRPAVPVLQILCLLAPPFVTNTFMWPALVAVNQTRHGLMFTIAQFLIGATLSFIAAPFGVIFIALSHLFRAFAVWPIGLHIMTRYVNISAKRTLKTVAIPLAAALAMAAATVLIQSLLAGRLPNVPTATILIAAGGIVYLVLTVVFAPEILRQIRTEVLTLVLRRRAE
jgi:O-antigen/teichoic acid export membrane protein